MGFLDPKERVMDIILTQYGRSKLAQEGSLKVKYYRFFDDEIDYGTPNITLAAETGASAILTESGDTLVTEGGDTLILE